MNGPAAPIGIFDSGVGGLSVWREIARQLPHEATCYVADQAHVPYGPRPADEVRGYAEALTSELLRRGCKAIVVACNTASAAALKDLRAAHPNVAFVGMEPAVKPAALHTKSGVVGVLATPGTLQGRMFRLAVERYGSGLSFVNQPCPGLVECIERGEIDAPGTELLLRELLRPMLDAGADTLVLACTHYPFVAPLIARIVGPAVQIVDPAPAVARQLARVLDAHGMRAPATTARHDFFTSGDPAVLRRALRQLAGVETDVRSFWGTALGATGS